jgi:hypothetical protein
LWILIAISPIIGIQIVMPNLLGNVGGGDLKTTFIQNVFAPVLIAIPLTLGYLMLDAYSKFQPSGTDAPALKVFMGTAKGMDLQISGVSTLQQLIMAIAAVVVVWMGVFMVANKTAAERITGEIQSRVKGFGWRVARLAQYAPVMPGGKSIPQMWQQKVLNPIAKIERDYGPNAGQPGQARNAAAVSRLMSYKGAQLPLGEHYYTLHETKLRKAFATSLGRMPKLEARKFIDTAAKKRALGLGSGATVKDLIKRLQTRVFPAHMQAFLKAQGITPSGGGGGTGGTTLTGAHQTALTNNGLQTVGFTVSEKIQAVAPGVELRNIKIEGGKYNRSGSTADLNKLKTHLKAYFDKLKSGGMADDKAKKCVQDVLKKHVPAKHAAAKADPIIKSITP